MRRSTDSLGAPPFSARRERHRGHHHNTKKKTSSPIVKEKRKAGTRAGLTKAAIVAAAAKLIESVGANGFSLRKLAKALGVERPVWLLLFFSGRACAGSPRHAGS